MRDYSQPVSKDVVLKTIESLKQNNINAIFVEDESKVKEEVLKLIPENSEVMQMTSVTLDELGISKEINESGKFNAVKPKLYSMDRTTQARDMARLGSAPEISIGSVHAITEKGEILIASNTGSNLPAYAYGSDKVIFVVGIQKIVTDLDEAMKRVYEYTLPLESERAKKAYGVPGSAVNKLLILNKDNNPERITVMFVNRAIGY